jgi:hypothetical protein
MSSGHIARVASAAVAQSGDSSRREATLRPAVPTLDIFGDLRVPSSRRARLAAPKGASPPAEEDGMGDREDDGPVWEDDAAPGQVLSSSNVFDTG